MSQQDLELVTRAMKAVCQRPKPDFDVVNALYSPDHAFVTVLTNKFGEDELQGAQGYRDFLQSEDFPEPPEFHGAVDVGPHTVLAVTTNRFRAAGGDIEIDQRFWLVITVADGKITRTEAYADAAEALEAARSKI